MHEQPYDGLSLFGQSGNRKYLNAAERQRLSRLRRGAKMRLFCLTLRRSGARIFEVLALTPAAINIESGVVRIQTLKNGEGLAGFRYSSLFSFVKISLVRTQPEARAWPICACQRHPQGSQYQLVRSTSCLPMGTGAANYESGDFGTSPFFEQLKGKPRPASIYASVVPISKHKGTLRI